MNAFKTVKFTSSAGKFDSLNLTTALVKFEIFSRKFGATKSKI
ncbi:hypothetical protein [uncultured Campylobacter sp.]|nr:hypothetical protein [uncultured Campylobacter sp.]